MRDCYRESVRESVRDSDVDEEVVLLISLFCISFIIEIVALDANLEKEYPVSRKGDNGGYGHLRSVGPSLLVYTLNT
jgi:hypothetical protein